MTDARNERLSPPSFMSSAASSSSSSSSSSSTNPELSKLIEIQQERASDAVAIFQETMGPLSDIPYCIATTGSDARNEKYSRLSPMEVMFIVDDSEESLSFSPIALSSAPAQPSENIRKINGVVVNMFSKYPGVFDGRVQVQGIKSNPLSFHSLSISGSQAHYVIPNRAVDATYLYGDKKLMETYQNQTLISLKSFNSTQRLKFNRKFLQESLNVLTACIKKTEKKPVDLEKGQLHYDGNRIKSTKYPFLRPVQYKLTEYIIKGVKDGKLTGETLPKMPKEIANRIIWLQATAVLPLSTETAQKISQAYNKALEWHLRSQDAFEKKIEVIEVDPKELGVVATTIYEFAGKMASFAIP